MDDQEKIVVAVFGGAVSGAEAAHQLAQRGIHTVVFDQNLLPYGKIEDGLPKWHSKLRDREENRINEKLDHPLVTFVPGIGLGEDLSLKEVVEDWGFSAVLLATGAWKDRPLPVAGIEDYVDRGLVYQNSFIYWYNHKHEPDYSGPEYQALDGAIIVGGGLASLDVAKALMFETTARALRELGHEIDLFSMDRSIAKVLDDLGIEFSELGLKGCTLYYRRRIKDMPLTPMPTDTPEQLAKAQMIREKILSNFQKKYLFNVAPCHVPVDKIVKEGRLAGLTFRKTRIENGRVIEIPGTEKDVLTPLVVSSIGSIPEVIEGIPMDGQIYRIRQEDCCRVEGLKNVFAIGNAVTGRGNIKESLDHGREVALSIIEHYLDQESLAEQSIKEVQSDIAEKVDQISDERHHFPSLSKDEYRRLMSRIEKLHQKTGYDGAYQAWVETHLPPRLEDMLGLDH